MARAIGSVVPGSAPLPAPLLGWERGDGPCRLLELLCCTCRSPHRARGLDGRGGAARGFLPDLRLNLGGKGRVLAKVVAHVLAVLAKTLVAVGHPGPALLEDHVLERGVDERALARDALVEQDVELRRAEGRRHLVLDHLHLHPCTYRVEPGFDDL